jgi:stress-induced morphogen
MADILGKPDDITVAIKSALDEYDRNHSRARTDVRRQNSASVRIRIIDSAFTGLDRVQRENLVWPMLRKLPEVAQDDISMLLLLTPEESTSPGLLMNFEFEHPLPSPIE